VDMAKLEEQNKKVIRKTKLQEAIFTAIASGGRMGSTELIPIVLNYFFELDIPSSSRRKEIIMSAANRLKKRGLLKFQDGHHSLTEPGEKLLKHWRMANYKIPRPKRWDGKWRVIIFDIPEKNRMVRTEVRQILSEAGFQRLQDSVWVFPYDCEDFIGLMKMDLEIGKNLLYMIVDQIENDRHLRMDFDIV